MAEAAPPPLDRRLVAGQRLYRLQTVRRLGHALARLRDRQPSGLLPRLPLHQLLEALARLGQPTVALQTVGRLGRGRSPPGELRLQLVEHLGAPGRRLPADLHRGSLLVARLHRVQAVRGQGRLFTLQLVEDVGGRTSGRFAPDRGRALRFRVAAVHRASNARVLGYRGDGRSCRRPAAPRRPSIFRPDRDSMMGRRVAQTGAFQLGC